MFRTFTLYTLLFLLLIAFAPSPGWAQVVPDSVQGQPADTTKKKIDQEKIIRDIQE